MAVHVSLSVGLLFCLVLSISRGYDSATIGWSKPVICETKNQDYESETKSAGIIQPIWSHQSWSRSVGVQPCAMSRLPTAPVQEVKDHKCPNPAILPARLGHKMSQRYTKVTIETGSLELKSAVWPFLSLRFIQSQFRDDWTSPSHLGIVGRIHVAQDFLMEVQLG